MTIIKMHDRGTLSILVIIALCSCALRVKAQVECSPGLDSYSDLRANASTDVVKEVIEVVESVFGDTIVLDTEDRTADERIIYESCRRLSIPCIRRGIYGLSVCVV